MPYSSKPSYFLLLRPYYMVQKCKYTFKIINASSMPCQDPTLLKHSPPNSLHTNSRGQQPNWLRPRLQSFSHFGIISRVKLFVYILRVRLPLSFPAEFPSGRDSSSVYASYAKSVRSTGRHKNARRTPDQSPAVSA